MGPFARAKRLRMVRTVHEPPSHVRFERMEHAAWILDAAVDLIPDGSRLSMRLRYGGRLWVPVLDRVLSDEIERSRPRLLARVSSL